ncbi:MAG TPA: TIGR03668 family PPOX class F420-dependent oxidoreductase [Solirubrobacteraceae bacterium]|nr:TIGR03668 family PPOX class F420-dependent oxidoreductase [Solirubrobacteraceae bacterium]
MNLSAAQARRRFSTATVARLATVGPDAGPHLVPITFALLGESRVVSAIDHKPKRTTALRRLANIAANPRVCLLVDHYEDDWSALWWARADGLARVIGPGVEPELRAAALDALAGRYGQYAQRRPAGELIVVEIEGWSGWAASG